MRSWAEARLELALHQESATEIIDSTAPNTDVDVMSTGAVHHRLNLFSGIDDTCTVFGVIVVSRHSGPPDKPSLSSLRLLARAPQDQSDIA